jgi:uncharacterized protein
LAVQGSYIAVIYICVSKTIQDCTGFEWDEGNSGKNWDLHGVSDAECEDIFFNQPLIVGSDLQHSKAEVRHYALGRTERDRWLFTAFTIRKKLIRVISARDMTRSEKRKYAEKIKRDTDLQD